MESSPSGVKLPNILEEARITKLPSAAYYIPNFISEDEERYILDKVHTRLLLMENAGGEHAGLTDIANNR